MSKRAVILSAVLLMLAHLFTELHSIVYAINPQSAKMTVNAWVVKKPPYDITILWWMKENADDLLITVLVFLAGKMALKVDGRMAAIFFTYLVYRLFCQVMLIYDFGQSYSAFWVGIFACIFITIILLIPLKEKS